jgi:hypothetical protein
MEATSTMNTRTNYRESRTHVLSYASDARVLPLRSPKLKPASQSYLHRDSQAAIIGVIFSLATILITAKIWLIRLLG